MVVFCGPKCPGTSCAYAMIISVTCHLFWTTDSIQSTDWSVWFFIYMKSLLIVKFLWWLIHPSSLDNSGSFEYLFLMSLRTEQSPSIYGQRFEEMSNDSPSIRLILSGGDKLTIGGSELPSLCMISSVTSNCLSSMASEIGCVTANNTGLSAWHGAYHWCYGHLDMSPESCIAWVSSNQS